MEISKETKDKLVNVLWESIELLQRFGSHDAGEYGEYEIWSCCERAKELAALLESIHE